MVRVLLVKLPFKRKNNIIGIKVTGGGKFLGGLELDTFSQMEGVFQAVI